jgi:glycosyltransferase involved in cell wall biosynthesis
MNNFFSIIIPLYNKAEYINIGLNSIFNQTYQKFEIIVVDDGSTDDGVDAINKESLRSIKIIKQKNQGVATARNIGALAAKYDYIVFLDADDIWENEFLFELNSLINFYPNYPLYGLNSKFRLKNGNNYFIDFKYLFNNKQIGLIQNYFEVCVKNKNSPFSNSSCAFNKFQFIKIGGYASNIKYTEDSDLWTRIALNNYIPFSNKPLSIYNLEIPNNSNTHKLFDYYYVIYSLENALKSNKVPSHLLESVLKYINYQKISFIKRLLLNNQKKLALNKLYSIDIFIANPIYWVILFFLTFVPFRCITFLRNTYKNS